MTDHDRPAPEADGPADDAQPATPAPAPSPALSESIAAAARRSGLGQLAETDTSTSAALLGALGGVRGLCETILPGLVFLILFTFTQNVPVSIVSSVAVAVVFTVARVIGKTPVTQAMAGLIGVGISAILALITGRGEDNFLLGIWTNAAYAAGILISMLVRWPVIGLAAGYLMGDGVAWRRDKRKFRVMQALTFLWFLLFAARLLVQVPLYLAHTDAATSALALTKLLMGVPLYAPLLLVTWFVVKGQFPQKPSRTTADVRPTK
ncbi:DUF3159 domain-containing protein [Leifsonia shinshuensis]|uniref:DUF3159 domain-containing protein n=1 Tax=Leifsonia shinshuensis TaxID=150026 RepID=UPI002856D68A|nr:DUF3159 domain-containing protein [Leifsonia shinshuensis]MDR6970809.1 hypothetical protein [Leifsonia shinshuensis]